MSNANHGLLEALLDSWDRNNTILVNDLARGLSSRSDQAGAQTRRPSGKRRRGWTGHLGCLDGQEWTIALTFTAVWRTFFGSRSTLCSALVSLIVYA